MNIEKDIKELEEKIEKNFNMITDNSEKINDNLERINRNSYVLEILRDYKEDSRRLFYILLIVIPMWVATIIYLIYVLSK